MSDQKFALATIMMVVDPEHPEAVETLTGSHTYLIDELEEAIHDSRSPLVDGATVVDIAYTPKIESGVERRDDGKLAIGELDGKPTISLDGCYTKQQLAALLFEMTRQETEEAL